MSDIHKKLDVQDPFEAVDLEIFDGMASAGPPSSARGMMIEVGWNRKGEIDFRVSGLVSDLTLEEMKELRAMIPVAIGTAEAMFRLGNEENEGKKTKKEDPKKPE